MRTTELYEKPPPGQEGSGYLVQWTEVKTALRKTFKLEELSPQSSLPRCSPLSEPSNTSLLESLPSSLTVLLETHNYYVNKKVETEKSPLERRFTTGPIRHIWRHFWLSQLGKMLLTSIGDAQHPTVQRTPPAQDYLTPLSLVPSPRIPAPEVPTVWGYI